MSFTTYLIPEPSKKKTAQTLKWLCIVSDHELLPAHDELLQRICQALKASYPEDVQVIRYSPSASITLSDLTTNHTSLILSFGLVPSALGLWIDLNSPGIRFLESFGFILSARLDELINQPSSKKQLWASMQSYMQWIESRTQNTSPGEIN
jgi:hypothetical protein